MVVCLHPQNWTLYWVPHTKIFCWLLLFLSTCSHLKCSKLIANFFTIKSFPTVLEDKCLKYVLIFHVVIKQNQPIYIYDICLQERWESFDLKKTAVSFEHFKCEHVERNNNNNYPTAPLKAVNSNSRM